LANGLPRSAVEPVLTIHQLTTQQQIEQLQPEWRALWDRDAGATPFQSPDWLVPWTAWLWGGGKLRVLALRREGELVAVAPFFLWGFGDEPEEIRLSFLGSGISDYLGMVCTPEYASEATRAVLRWIAGSSGEWHTCDLQELRHNAPLLETQPPLVLDCRRIPYSLCPVLRLPEKMEDLLASLDPKFRRNLKVAGNRLHAAGRVEFIRAEPSNVRELLDVLFRLHAERWNARGGGGMFATEALRSFHREIARRFCATGMLRLHALALDGEVIAVQYNFLAKGRLYLYLSGFDARFGRSSPGAVLLARSIGAAIAEGAREADFLRQPEAFKYDWGARDQTTMRLLIRTAGRTRAVTGGTAAAALDPSPAT
jgi:CelD/BcsL family acetyltransferase involved in cellulose biosynthesis